MTTESAIKELEFATSFKTVQHAKVKLWPLALSYSKVVVEWPFRENGAERIYTALVEVGFSNLKCVFKSFYSS